MKLFINRHTRYRLRPMEGFLIACASVLVLFLVGLPYSGAVASAIVIVPTAPVPSTDVALSVSADEGPVQAGDLLTYDAEISNVGPIEATNVNVDIDLPGRSKKPDVTVVSVDSTQGTCEVPDGGLKFRCALGSVPAGFTAQIEIVVQITDGANGTLKASFNVNASERDTDPPNNRVRTATAVQ